MPMKPKKEVLSNKFISFFLNKITSFLINKFVKSIEGEENIPKGGPYIIAANHVSYMDAVIAHNVFSKNSNYKIHFIISNGIKWLWWIFGGEIFLKWAIGFIPTPERRGNKGNVPTVDVALNVLKQGGIIAIPPYPKFDPREKIKIKTGVARLALWAKVPVIPIAIKGSFSVVGNKKPELPKTYKKIIRVKIGKPLYFDRYYPLISKNWDKNRKLYRTVSEHIVNKIENMLQTKF